MMLCRFAQSAAFFFLVVIVFAVEPQRAVNGQETDRETSSPAGDDARDLIFLAADRPVFVRIRLQIDGKGFRTRWGEYAVKLFASLDADNSGFLDKSEAEKVPPELAGAVPGGLWSAVDVDPRDGKIGRDEFRRFAVRSLDRSLAFRVRSTRRSQSVGLFGMLDRNGDGQLSADEVTGGYETLRSRDIDANDVLGVDELLPPQDPLGTLAASANTNEQADLPFIELKPSDGGGYKQAVAVLLSRYATAGKSAGNNSISGLSRERLGLDEKTFARFDNDGNHLLTADELPLLLKAPQPHVRLLVQLKVRRFGRPRISLVGGESDVVTNVRQERTSALRLAIAGIDLELRATRPRTTTFDAAQFFKLRFLMADADKNKYLDPAEFPTVNLPGVAFETVDRDGDGKIFRPELEAYVDRVNDTADSQLSLTVSKEGRSLFEVVDANSDLRLSRREFRSAVARLAEFDTNGDRLIADTEFAYRYRLSFRTGESRLLTAQDQNLAVTQSNRGAPVVRDNTAGPEWFRRMDRNRDGDVSPREFLGSRETFDRLDLNNDGLLSADEAGQAEGERGR